VASSQSIECAVPANPLAIISLPSSTSIGANPSVSFTAGAQGVGVTYQWRSNGNPITNGGNFSGVTTATLTVAAAAAAGLFDCVVTDACGSTATVGPVTGAGPAQLVIEQPNGPLSIQTTVTSAFPNAHYFSFYTLDSLNAAAPGQGPWLGVFIPLPELLSQYTVPAVPFNGTLGPAGDAVFSLPAYAMPPSFLGLTAAGATYITHPTTGAYLGSYGPALCLIQ
jgi:hypothetical protein